jgi:hypothetical protein
MPPSDLDIQRLAHQLIQRHGGDKAVRKTRQKVDEMRRKGSQDGADMWLRVIVAIGELGEPPTEARH